MSITKPFFGGNWKMNHGPSETRAFAEEFLRLYAPRDDRTVTFFPPAISLAEFRSAVASREDLRLGVQDVYWEESGAYTGSISAPMARDAGAAFVIAGHSERRHVFGDSDEDVGRKVAAIVRARLIPVLCVGEKLEERERGAVEAVVRRQLEAGVSALSAEEIEGLVVAYEPVWAIGTGRTARAEDANQVHELIRAALTERTDEAAAQAIPIIYGGSVKTGNIEELLIAEEIDGALVGGASLRPADFAEICQAGGR